MKTVYTISQRFWEGFETVNKNLSEDKEIYKWYYLDLWKMCASVGIKGGIFSHVSSITKQDSQQLWSNCSVNVEEEKKDTLYP